MDKREARREIQARMTARGHHCEVDLITEAGRATGRVTIVRLPSPAAARLGRRELVASSPLQRIDGSRAFDWAPLARAVAAWCSLAAHSRAEPCPIVVA